MKKRICIVTLGHLSTTPRMVKAADALADDGYDVVVVSARFMDWGDEGDRSIIASRWSKWRWTTVDYRRHGAFPRYAWSGIRMKAAQLLTRARGVDHTGLDIAARVRERVGPELISAVVRTRPALIYGGGSALAVAATAAQRASVPFAFDLEDFQPPLDPPGPYAGVTEKIERQFLPEAAVLTAGSSTIAEEYRSFYGLDVVPIDNVFSLPEEAPAPRQWDGILRLYWFGQTVGRRRGFEEAILAVGLAGIKSQLTIRGVVADDYLSSLQELAAEVAPTLTLVHLPPASPNDMVDLCRPHDVGVALENPEHLSRDLALSNKSLTYILAGLAVAMTDTRGQHELGIDLGEGALLCPIGEVEELAKGLKKWSEQPDLLATAKAAAWNAAKTRWHWEHPQERGRLLDAIAAVVG